MTPDGRYFIAKGRLWRCTNPKLDAEEIAKWKSELGKARAAVRNCGDDDNALKQARRKVQEAKVALGERGPVWWTDGAQDETMTFARNSSYAQFWQDLSQDMTKN